MKRPLRLTAVQRLGRRVDLLVNVVKSHDSRLDGLAQRMQELSQTFAETAHMGNWEAMYRLEREETIRLRLQEPVALETVNGWIAQLEDIAARLRFPLAVVRVEETLRAAATVEALTAEEQRILEKFRTELHKGTGGR